MRSDGESVLAELRAFRSKIPSEKLLRWESPTGWPCCLPIAKDWTLLLGAHQLFVRSPNLLTFIAALVLMSWGQRGLSCLAHDSIHRNLVKNRKLNDIIADIFLAPPAMSTAKLQRHGHDLHHRFLGSSMDPDHGEHSATSLKHYRTGAYHHKNILSLFVYDAFDSVLFSQNAIGALGDAPMLLIGWWTVVSFLTRLIEPAASNALFGFAGFEVSNFVILFHLSRCTLSYAFYVLREIIDHSGLPSSSVLSFTRSSPWGNWFQKFLQPHDDNYHLLHHLLPKVPMSHLREADMWLKANCKEYAAAHHYESYVVGENALFMQKLHEQGVFGDPDSCDDAPVS